jgi:hypothetical protein
VPGLLDCEQLRGDRADGQNAEEEPVGVVGRLEAERDSEDRRRSDHDQDEEADRRRRKPPEAACMTPRG